MRFLDSLAPAERQAFAAVAEEHSFPRGSRLMSEGEPANYVVVILSGWTRITVKDDGGERVIAERGPGQLVGERNALRLHARSATVTALDTVRGLVMKTEDFASFISAHPRVLDVVENQIYGELTEDLETRGQEDQPASVWDQANSVASHAPPGRLQPRLLNGENCTVVLTDVVGFGASYRSDLDRRIIRRTGLEMVRASLGSVWDACISEDRGDGLLIVAPPQVPTARIMTDINRELPRQLRVHNRTYAESARIQLRVAVNVGPVTGDLFGLSGDVVNRTARFVGATVIKDAMKAAGVVLGLIVSSFVYDTAIGYAGDSVHAAEYEQVEVSTKEFHTSAWLRRAYDEGPEDADIDARSRRRAALDWMTEEAGHAGTYGDKPEDYTDALKRARKQAAQEEDSS